MKNVRVHRKYGLGFATSIILILVVLMCLTFSAYSIEPTIEVSIEGIHVTAEATDTNDSNSGSASVKGNETDGLTITANGGKTGGCSSVDYSTTTTVTITNSSDSSQEITLTVNTLTNGSLTINDQPSESGVSTSYTLGTGENDKITIVLTSNSNAKATAEIGISVQEILTLDDIMNPVIVVNGTVIPPTSYTGEYDTDAAGDGFAYNAVTDEGVCTITRVNDTTNNKVSFSAVTGINSASNSSKGNDNYIFSHWELVTVSEANGEKIYTLTGQKPAADATNAAPSVSPTQEWITVAAVFRYPTVSVTAPTYGDAPDKILSLFNDKTKETMVCPANGTYNFSVPKGAALTVTPAISNVSWNYSGVDYSAPATVTMPGNDISITATGSGSASYNGSTYLYLENALKDASASGSASTVILLQNYTLTESVTVGESVTFVVPYAYGKNSVNKADSTKAPHANCTDTDGTAAEINLKKDLYLTLSIPNGLTLNVKGIMAVGGATSGEGSLAGVTNGPHSNVEVLEGGKLVVDGVLACTGYIYGDGIIEANDGAKLYQPYIISDFRGGPYFVSSGAEDSEGTTYYIPTVSKNDERIMSYARYAMLNLQPSKIIMKSGASMFAYVHLYAGKQHNRLTVCVIGDTGWITLNNDAVLNITYDETVHPKDYLPWIGKTTIEIVGGASFGSQDIVLDLSVAKGSVNSRVVSFPVPYNFDFLLTQGDYHIPYSLQLLPGATMTVSAGSTLYLDGESEYTFTVFDGLHDYTHNGSTSNHFTLPWETTNHNPYPTTAALRAAPFNGNGMANFIINGKLVIGPNVRIGGLIQTQSDSAEIEVQNNLNMTVDTQVGLVGHNPFKDKLSGLAAAAAALMKLENFYFAGATVRTLSAQVLGPNGELIPLQPNTTYSSIKNPPIQATYKGYEFRMYYNSEDVSQYYSLYVKLSDGALVHAPTQADINSYTGGAAILGAWKCKTCTPGAAATCTTAQTCTVCGDTIQAALGHNMVDVSAKNPTCTEEGYNAHKDCSRCDYTEGKVTSPALGHKDGNKDHTCDNGCGVYQGTHADGNTDHNCDYGCSEKIGMDKHTDANNDGNHVCDYGCGATLSTCGDSNTDHICDTDSACTAYSTGNNAHQNGTNTHICSYCGKAASTCSDAAGDGDHNCDICNEADVTGHNYGELIPAQQVVHTSTELKPSVEAHYHCTECDTYFDTDYNPTTKDALTGETPVHSFGAWQTNDEQHWKECVCGLRSEQGAHSDGEDDDSNCDTCDLQLHSCSGTLANGKPADCLIDGWKGYVTCSCGKYYEDEACTKEILDLAKWKEGDGKIAAPGKHSYESVVTPPTVDAQGYTTHTCSACGDSYVDNYTDKLTAVAQISGQRYETLAKAIEAAQPGDTVELLTNVELTGITVVPEGVTLDFNGKTLKGTVLGKLSLNGGTLVTAEDYKMAGPDAHYYQTNDAVLILSVKDAQNASLCDVELVSGTLTVVPNEWWTGVGQTMIIDEGATFVIPAGKTMQILSTVIVKGTVTIEGTANLYTADATIEAEQGLNVTTTAGDKVLYVDGKYVVHNHSYNSVYIDPTFDADGYTKYTCTNTLCGHSYTVPDEGTQLTAVAQIGGQRYETLAEAVAAAENGATVTLLCDATGAGVVINKSITIDFGGHTYTFTEGVGSTGTTSNGFQILQGNTVTLMNGKLEVAESAKSKFYILIQNYANLTVTNMTLDGTNLDKWSTTDGDSYVLSNNSGTVAINGETNIIANNDGDKAFAFDVCKYGNYEAPIVNVNTTGTITGKIEVTAEINSNLNISGGTFTVAINEAWCESGFIPTDNGDGTYGVKAGKYVAVVNGVKYETLADAVAAALNGQTVTLLCDATGAGVVINKSITIDFAGHTYTFNKAVGSAGTETLGFQILQGSTVTLKNGTLTSIKTVEGKEVKVLIQNYANLTLTDMNLVDDTNHILYCLSNNSGNVVLDGNTNITTDAVAFDVYKYGSYEAPNVNVDTTGKIDGKIEVTAEINGNLNISGGTFTVAINEAWCESGFIPTDNGDGTYGVKAGEYVAIVDGVKFETLAEAIAAAEDGQTVILLCDATGAGVVINKSIIIDFAGHTYTFNKAVGSAGTETLGFQILQGNDVILTNGTLTSTAVTSGKQVKVLIQNYANLTLTDMSLVDNTEHILYCLSNNSGNVVLDGNTNITTDAVAFDVYKYGSYEAPVVRVNTTGKIDGKIEVTAEINGNLNISGGTFTVAINEAWCESGFIPTDNGDGTYGVKVGEYVAIVDGVKYETLAEAVAAAEDGATVTLLCDATGAGVVINKSITIDFAGHTYTFNKAVGSAGTETLGLQILSGHNVTLKNGTLTSIETVEGKEVKVLIQNYANLTLIDMNLVDNTEHILYCLSNNSGNVVLDGNTNITTDAVAFDVYKYGSYDAPNVNVNTTGTITGKIEVSESINKNLNISGGTFTVAINEAWCAAGFGPNKDVNADGTYGVHEHVAGAVVVENKVDATCTAEGSYDNVVYCTECGAELSRETVKVNMLEHTPNEGVIEHIEGTTTHTVTVSCTVCKGNLSTETKNCTDADNSFACDACGGFVMNDFSSFVIIAEELSGNKTVEGSVVTLKYTGNVSFAPAQGVGAWNHWFGFKITAPTGVDVTKVIILRPDDVTRVMGNILDGDYYAYLYWGMTNEQDRIAEYKIDWNGDGEYDLTVVLDATGATLLECQHAWDQGEETTKATCTQEGVMTYTCANCGATKTENIGLDVTNHKNVVTTEAKEPTCTEDGWHEYKYCTECSTYIVPQDTIPATGHTEEVDAAKAPTCTETGLTEGKHCSVCKEVLVKQEVVDALAHDYEVTDFKNATCTEDGYETYTCKNDATHTYTEEIKATGHNYVDGACSVCETPAFVPNIGGNNPDVSHDHSNEDGTVVTTFRAGTSADAPLVTITSPEGGWTQGTNTFQVSCEKACVVIVSYDGGQTYDRLDATATEIGNDTYTFIAENMGSENTVVKILMNGDVNGDGQITNADITVLRAVYNGKIDLGYMFYCGNLNGDQDITNADITIMQATYFGKITLPWQ